MKFFRAFRYDLKNGILHNWTLLLIPALTVLLCDKCRNMLAVYDYTGSWSVYIMYCFEGARAMTREAIQANKGFQLPALWVAMLVLPLFACLNYPFRDIKTVGTQILLRSGSRVRWWLSKCLWNLLVTVICFLLVCGSAAAYCLCTGGALDMNISGGALRTIYAEVYLTEAAGNLTVKQFAFVVLLLFSAVAALDMLEMLLSLLIKPVYSFIVSVGLIAASAYASTPLLIGNYANPARFATIAADGLNERVGLMICLAVFVLSVSAGIFCFRRRNILPDYKEL